MELPEYITYLQQSLIEDRIGVEICIFYACYVNAKSGYFLIIL